MERHLSEFKTIKHEVEKLCDSNYSVKKIIMEWYRPILVIVGLFTVWLIYIRLRRSKPKQETKPV